MSGGLAPRPSRDFVPAADSLSWAPKKVSKETAPVPSPLRFAAGSPAMLGRRGPRKTPSATLRSNSCAESVDEVRCAHASPSCASRLLQGGVPKQPTAKPDSRSQRGIRLPPFEPAEERKVLRPCAQRTLRTDSAQLFEQSVAARVLRGASRPEYRREPLATRGAGGSGALSLPTFLCAQESRSPAGANSRHYSRHKTRGAKT